MDSGTIEKEEEGPQKVALFIFVQNKIVSLLHSRWGMRASCGMYIYFFIGPMLEGLGLKKSIISDHTAGSSDFSWITKHLIFLCLRTPYVYNTFCLIMLNEDNDETEDPHPII
jgi:hypothetical protein